ncbi:hypothetical protein [Ruegeria sp. HKCCA4633]|uniref:hypothetical protein n=1 Tax=Ruegeria sp. HKCCA4633 TaxID=2682983 RepID=UPI00148A097B|nr:hypothetical protein [Ruegeria sp. HKCCA4633]
MLLKSNIWPLTFFALFLLCTGLSGGSYAETRQIKYKSDHWEFVLPPSIKPVSFLKSGFAAKEELGSPYHSIVFQVLQDGSIPYDHPTHDDQQRKVFLRQILPYIVAERRSETAEERNDRVVSSSTSSLPSGFVPAGEICGGFQWKSTDKGVPGHIGKTFAMEGYTLICLGSRTKSKTAEYVEIVFSERYCRELGHSPTKDFQRTARRILTQVRYLRD